MAVRKEVDNLYKGAEFLADLKRRLFLERFVTAIPEPDIGEDLWVIDTPASPDGNDAPMNMEIARLRQCQVKSAHSFSREGQKIKHLVNFTKACRIRIRPGFYFLIGLRNEESDRFHLGCFPGEFFQKLTAEEKLRFTDQDRNMLDGRGPGRCGTAHFVSRACSAAEACPQATYRRGGFLGPLGAPDAPTAIRAACR